MADAASGVAEEVSKDGDGAALAYLARPLHRLYSGEVFLRFVFPYHYLHLLSLFCYHLSVSQYRGV